MAPSGFPDHPGGGLEGVLRPPGAGGSPRPAPGPRAEDSPASRTVSVDFWPERAGDLDLRRTEEIKPRHYQDFVARDPLYRDAKYSPEKYVPYTLQNSALGIARTHEVVLSFSAGETPARLAALHAAPFVPFAGAEWNVSTGALGKQVAPGARPDIDAAAEAVAERVLREVEECGWYGEMVYGNVRYLIDEDKQEWLRYHPKFAWFNSEHLMFIGGNLHHVMWQLYLRTGNPRYYAFAEARGRAKADLSVLHHGPCKGQMVRHGGFDPWVGARHAIGEHASLCGLDLHYSVTGSPRMLDVLHLAGQAHYARVQLNHGRGMATDLDSMMRYWQLTGDRKYYDRCLEYIAHYEATFDKLKTYDGYWTYRVTALQQFHEFCDDPAARERVKKIFIPNWQTVTGGRGSRMEDAGFVYELAPTPDHAAYLAAGLPRILPKSWQETRWGGENFPTAVLMNEVAGLGALWYNAYWAQKLPAGTLPAAAPSPTPPPRRGEGEKPGPNVERGERAEPGDKPPRGETPGPRNERRERPRPGGEEPSKEKPREEEAAGGRRLDGAPRRIRSLGGRAQGGQGGRAVREAPRRRHDPQGARGLPVRLRRERPAPLGAPAHRCVRQEGRKALVRPVRLVPPHAGGRRGPRPAQGLRERQVGGDALSPREGPALPSRVHRDSVGRKRPRSPQRGRGDGGDLVILTDGPGHTVPPVPWSPFVRSAGQQ
jgi:hypothetical protein